MERIYLDFNATTPLAPEVSHAMREAMELQFGNASSLHWAGQRSRDAVAAARQRVAALLGCAAHEVVFTSGGTEANNSALAGVFFGLGRQRCHFVISSIEHPSITKTCEFLERLGASITRVAVDRCGMVDPDDVRRALRNDTALVSIMHSNNEIGTLQPIKEIAAIARELNILCHSDAAQSVGKVPVDVNDLGVDLLSVAGHKMYAPQGVGALYIRQGVELEPFMHGAAHENGRRAGTENILEIVGLGAACDVAQRWTGDSSICALRDHFWKQLQQTFGEHVHLNGHPHKRLPNTLNVSFAESQGHEILAHLPMLAASTGSACHAASYEMSPVLAALGLPPALGLGAIRFSLGRSSTIADVEAVAQQLSAVLQKS